MGHLHLGHERLAHETLSPDTEHLWELAAEEALQNEVCRDTDGYLVVEFWASMLKPDIRSIGGTRLSVFSNPARATRTLANKTAASSPALRYGDKHAPYGSVAQRVVIPSADIAKATTWLVSVININMPDFEDSPDAYHLMASCVMAANVQCPRGGPRLAPCFGLGPDYTGACLQENSKDPSAGFCQCNASALATCRAVAPQLEVEIEDEVEEEDGGSGTSSGQRTATAARGVVLPLPVKGFLSVFCLVAAVAVLVCWGPRALHALTHASMAGGLSPEAIEQLPLYKHAKEDPASRSLQKRGAEGARARPRPEDSSSSYDARSLLLGPAAGRTAMSLAQLGGWNRAAGIKAALGMGSAADRGGDGGGAGGAAGQPKCEVCSYSLQDGELVRQLPCSHEVHRGCADTWLAVHSQCPVCGLNLAELPLPS